MDWRNVAHWVVEVAGTFVSIAAFINIVLGQRNLPFYGGVFAVGLLVIFAGLSLRPKPAATVR